MRTWVWVDSWQQQCCGDEFGVGSDVSWSVVPSEGHDEWVGLVLDAAWSARVAFHEEHHVDDELDTQTLTGTASSINEVRCRRTRGSDGLVPVPGSGWLTVVTRANPWAAEAIDDEQDPYSFDGWIVGVEDAHVTR